MERTFVQGQVGSIALFLVLLGTTAGDSLRAEGWAPSNRITSFMPAFYDFWEKAKDKELGMKLGLWNSLFECRYADFYRQVIYDGSSGEELERMKASKVQRFLSGLTDQEVQAMKRQERVLNGLIPEALTSLASEVPSANESPALYIIPSLYTSSGACRPYDGQIVVYYGLEVLAGISSPQVLKANIVHEAFHAVHFRSFGPALQKNSSDPAAIRKLMFGEGPLFIAFFEGLAVAVTERTCPGAPKPGIVESNIASYEKNFHGGT